MSEPIDSKAEMQARIAWLYYVGNLTQQDIAKKVGISRPTVQRLLNLAVESGIVQVKINHTAAHCMDLAQRLKRRFRLTECEVAPLEDDQTTSVERFITMTSSRFLGQTLRTAGIGGIALGTGRAVSAMCHAVSRHHLDDFKVLSLAGTIATDGSFNRYDASLILADKMDGKYFMLSLPLFAESEDDRAYWYNTRTYQRQLANYAQCHTAFIGIGSIDAACSLVLDGFITPDTARELMQQGAVGDVLGWVLDGDGAPLAHPLNRRITSFRQEVLKTRPVIGVAGGERKHAAIRAVLRGGWLNGLITDQKTAEYLLNRD